VDTFFTKVDPKLLLALLWGLYWFIRRAANRRSASAAGWRPVHPIHVGMVHHLHRLLHDAAARFVSSVLSRNPGKRSATCPQRGSNFNLELIVKAAQRGGLATRVGPRVRVCTNTNGTRRRIDH
jgi:hypothetical protein